MIFLLGTFMYLLALVLCTLWKGYVVSVMWGWFIVPLFGVPPLAISHAVGVSFLVSILTLYQVNDEKGKLMSERLIASIFFSATYPLLVLIAGWITKGYLPR